MARLLVYKYKSSTARSSATTHHHTVQDGDENTRARLPSDAELIFSSTASSYAEAQTEVDRFLGHPPYLDVRAMFQAALKSGLRPSEAVRKVHIELGAVGFPVWPDHFHDALGADRGEIASLFVAWWPTGRTDLTDDEFDRRVLALTSGA